ncbi:amidohydrolase [bacterium]|nr:amidohydrolase [bacterium]
MKALRTVLGILILTWLNLSAAQLPVAPATDNVEREQGDNGFSRGFGDTNHAWSFDWFDSHMHLAYSHFPNVLNRGEIQEVMDGWFRRVGVYDCTRAILLDPYLETMEWAKDDPRVYVFWWMTWEQQDSLPAIKSRTEAGLIQGLKLHTGDFRRKADPDYHVMGTAKWHAIYDYCGKAGLPVLIHVSEHWGDQDYTTGVGSKKFWARAGYTNQELLDYFLTEMVAKHPDVKWIVAHMNFQGLKTLSALFEKYPNLYVDTSIGMYLREYDRLTAEEIAPYREFCIRWADRLMFGTDGFAYQPLESEYPGHVRNWWLPHYIFLVQLGLPQETLDKISHGTCEKVLGKYLKPMPGQ